MSTGFSPDTRTVIVERDRGLCRRCSTDESPVAGEEVHHRRGRGMGGTSRASVNLPANGVLLCGDCHRWVEKNRAEAYATGWAVRRSFPGAESQVPLQCLDGVVLWLDDDGGVAQGLIGWRGDGGVS